MKTREGRWKQMVAIGAALALLAAFFWWQNNGLTVSRYEFTSTKVPRELDGYTIVQLSDLQVDFHIPAGFPALGMASAGC